MNKFSFYLSHSLTDLRVNGRRTLFALLCIASGVAAVVSLLIVGSSLLYTLTVGAQEQNRGDIKLSAPVALQEPAADLLAQSKKDGVLATYETGFGYVEHSIAPKGLEKIRAWLEQQYPGTLVAMTTQQQAGDPRKLQIKTETRGTQAYGPQLFLVERERYPLYGSIATVDGVLLAQALAEPGTIALNRGLADKLKLQLGDAVTLTGMKGKLTVAGIVPDNAEAGAEAQGLVLSGYIYIDQATVAAIAERAPSTTVAYLKLREGAPVATIGSAMSARFPYLSLVNAQSVASANTELNRQLALVSQVVGFLALLIGGIGIMNTMTVIVRRRMVEVAVLKTIGLQGREITTLFLVQAVLMGLTGSIVGVTAGYLLPLVLRDAASGVLQTDLRLLFGSSPAITGLVMGVVVTAVFGFLPTLSAGQVRPITVLRPNDAVVGRLGALRTGITLLGMALAIALVAIPIFGNPIVALGTVAGGLVGAGLLAGLLTLVLSLLVPLLARLVPVDLKIALRSMLAARGRTVSTALALATGALMLSLVLMLVNTTVQSINVSMASSMGGTAQVMLKHRVSATEMGELLRQGKISGYHGHFIDRGYHAVLVRVETTKGSFTLDELRRQREAEVGVGKLANLSRQLSGQIDAVELTPRIASSVVDAGRALTSSDAGKLVMVLHRSREVTDAGLQPGDRLTYAFGGLGGEEQTFELVGINEQNGVNANANIQVPYDALPDSIRPEYYRLIVDIDEAQMASMKQLVKQTPSANMLTADELNRMVASLLRQFAVLPIVVTLISLIVSAVVIANSVALSTMERRRDIGVMKAMGLQRGRVLGMLLGENAVLGLVGGLAGVLPSLVALIALLNSGGFGEAAKTTPIPYDLALGLVLLCAAVGVVSAFATAWGASGQKPITVLRYE